MLERKTEEGSASGIFDKYLGKAAYAAIPEVPETKAEKEVKDQDFQLLYGEEKRITSFPKSPGIVSIKLPDGITTFEALNAKINALKLSNESKSELDKLEELNNQIKKNKAFQAQFDKLIGALIAWAPEQFLEF